MASADLVQTNGLGLSLASAMKTVDGGLKLDGRSENAGLEPAEKELMRLGRCGLWPNPHPLWAL